MQPRKINLSTVNIPHIKYYKIQIFDTLVFSHSLPSLSKILVNFQGGVFKQFLSLYPALALAILYISLGNGIDTISHEYRIISRV